MRTWAGILLVIGIILASCGPKPQYKTAKGKKKLKHYNSLQFNKKDWDEQRYRPKKKKN